MSINVVVVEDDNEVRETLTKIIASATDLSCIAAFPSAEKFMEALPHLHVDVVLMDIHLPGENGIQTVARLKDKHPAVQFLMCTSFDDPQRTFDSLTAGATGYLLKNTSPGKICEAIREIHVGGSPMSPEIARLVVKSFTTKEKPNKYFQLLSAREQEILTLLSKGFQYKQIADKLSISVETVRTHIRNIYEILQVHSRTDALNKAFRS